jgi:dolichyl-phosphate beta-glucosyltransferase
VPIDWYYRSESRVQPLADPLRMLADILRIRRNWRAGVYGSPRAAEAASELRP